MKFKIGDGVRFVKDTDLKNYPKTATSLIKLSKQIVGEKTVIDKVWADTKEGRAFYPYRIITSVGGVLCKEEELERIEK